MQNDHNLYIALMLLEMVLTKIPGEPDLADDVDMLWAAHSFAQASNGRTPVSDEALALYSKVKAAVAIEDARQPNANRAAP